MAEEGGCMSKVLDYVNPFWGTEETRLPHLDGLSSKWYFLKAQVGNCHPGACRPFGMVSVLPYSGAYPTGYGVYSPNSYGLPPKYYKGHRCRGFTHFHVSGTGSITKYYNFVRVIPLTGTNSATTADYELIEEKAAPGGYSARLGDSGIFCRVAAGKKSAFHSYSFSRGRARLAIDFLTCGLIFKEYDRNEICEAIVRRRDSRYIEACLWTDFPLYVCVRFEKGGEGESQWVLDGAPVPISQEIALEDAYSHTLQFVYTGRELEKEVVIQAAFSLKGFDQARRNLENGKNFSEILCESSLLWEQALNKIHISVADEKIKRTFYSCLYHSLIKPCNFYGESPFWEVKKEFYVDFATLWDQYKTHLPLIVSLYPETASGIVNSLLNMADYMGEFPNKILMSSPSSYSSDQAVCLAVYTITDAYLRNVPGIDWKRALHIINKDLEKKAKKLKKDTPYVTHLLDYTEACRSASLIAQGVGEFALAEKWKENWKFWEQAYDPANGLIRDGIFYEGHKKTYSFRLLHDMKKRISYFPPAEGYIRALDNFFGYHGAPVERSFEGISYEQNEIRSASYGRFEGLNNESDMETPYAYIYAGRHDRTAEILRSIMWSMFDDTPNGAPGNNDSGALSSWYVWNAIGLFPVSGQNLILIGSPILSQTVFDLKNKKFIVHAQNVDWDRPYVVSAELNGKPIDRAWLTVDEMIQGGELRLSLSDQPSGFGKILPYYNTITG